MLLRVPSLPVCLSLSAPVVWSSRALVLFPSLRHWGVVGLWGAACRGVWVWQRSRCSCVQGRVKERNGQAGVRGSDPAPVQTRLGSGQPWFLQQTPMGRGETTESTLSGEPWEGLRGRLRRGVLVLWVQGPLRPRSWARSPPGKG